MSFDKRSSSLNMGRCSNGHNNKKRPNKKQKLKKQKALMERCVGELNNRTGQFRTSLTDSQAKTHKIAPDNSKKRLANFEPIQFSTVQPEDLSAAIDAMESLNATESEKPPTENA